MSLRNKLNIKDIHLIVYDFDGIMTDNRVIVFENGQEAIIANRGDGQAINILKRKKIPQIIISTEKNKVVKARAEKIGLPLIQDVSDKKQCLFNYCRKNRISLKNVVYLGNDTNDLEAMKIVGYPIAPIDAHADVRKISKIILSKKGGEGLIRELVGLIK